MNDHPDDHSELFPDTATRLASERFARHPSVEALNAIENALRAAPGEIIEVSPSEMDNVLRIIEQRRTVHGEFRDNAGITQAFKYQLTQGKNWNDLTAIQKEALEMIVHKIGRILSGDPNHKDHWTDIIGYARLVEQRL